MPQRRKRLVIGVGNEHRGDDAVGLLVASRLKPRAGECFRVFEWRGDQLALFDEWKDADTVIILDAASSDAQPGQIHRIDASKQPLAKDMLHCSTHAFGVVEAIELARALGQLPRQLIVYAIEGQNFDAGALLSPSVEEAALAVEALVLRDLAAVSEFGAPAE
ncbi:MAG TPA: hydrogenase maturation protease [Blastocatellia bacterium]|nr:hydrogenase maturation protease [Blastocatellia bacterium]